MEEESIFSILYNFLSKQILLIYFFLFSPC